MLTALLVGSATPASAADELRPLEVDDYFALKNIGSPVVSPDSQWVAYTVSSQDLEKDSRGTRVWMISADGGDPLPLAVEEDRPELAQGVLGPTPGAHDGVADPEGERPAGVIGALEVGLVVPAPVSGHEATAGGHRIA